MQGKILRDTNSGAGIVIVNAAQKKNLLKIATLSCAAFLLFGCSTSKKVQVVQAGDQNLTCSQIKDEFAKLDKSQEEIESKKGVTGTNVVSTLLWLPGLAYTYYDAGEATELIGERRSSLTNYFNQKNCKK